MNTPGANIARHLPEVAKRLGPSRAVVHGERQLTFAELDRWTNAIARGLSASGISRGMRTMLLVKPSLELIPLTFALFKMGAVPVMIDPGLGRKGFLRAAEEVEPEAFIGIPVAHALRMAFRASFRTVRHLITVGRRWGWGGATFSELLGHDDSPLDLAPTPAAETAAVLFTSGSTGPAKGAVYTHGIFDAQLRLIRDEWHVTEGEVDLPVFPLFALFSTALGATVIVPAMDPTRPARADAAKMVATMESERVTYSFGSPAFWNRIAGYGRPLTTLRRVFIAGAPVAPDLVERMQRILPEGGEVIIPYGATESLPVSWIRGGEVIGETAARTRTGAGTCVGRPVQGLEVRILGLTDDAIATMSDASPAAAGEIGEIAVKGPVVTKSYYRRDRDTALSKIQDGKTHWHRMGDLGYLDEQGRIWFCGRKSHRVETSLGRMYTIPCEAIFNQHPKVYRSALVGLGERGRQTPAIVIECHPGQSPRTKSEEDTLRAELLTLARQSPLTTSIEHVLFHPSFPVDIRHNAKIFRDQLARWAEGRLTRPATPGAG